MQSITQQSTMNNVERMLSILNMWIEERASVIHINCMHSVWGGGINEISIETRDSYYLHGRELIKSLVSLVEQEDLVMIQEDTTILDDELILQWNEFLDAHDLVVECGDGGSNVEEESEEEEEESDEEEEF